jgi:hypothetical protein
MEVTNEHHRPVGLLITHRLGDRVDPLVFLDASVTSPARKPTMIPRVDLVAAWSLELTIPAPSK